MKLNTFTDYALRVLIYLAAHPGQRATVQEICAAYGIKNNHLSKVVHLLGKRGWIETTRGKGGGITLAMQPEAISLGQVVRDAEGEATPAECFTPERGACPISQSCRLQGVLAQAVDAFHATLDRYTLADITRNRRELASILHFHPRAAAA